MDIRRRLTLGAGATLGLSAVIVLGSAVAASAHVSVEASDTAADSYTTVTFSVPHGCDGSPTTALTFHLPSSVIEATPTVNPNWTIAKATEPYTDPSASASSESEDPDDAGTRVTSVTYTARTPLPADERDTFQLSFSLPDGKAGDVVELPVTQTCEQGTVEWNEAQKAGEDEPDHPAPSVTLTQRITDADDDDDHAAEHATGSATTAAAAGTTTAGPDNVARGLGIAGLVVGAVGIVSAVAATRKRTR